MKARILGEVAFPWQAVYRTNYIFKQKGPATAGPFPFDMAESDTLKHSRNTLTTTNAHGDEGVAAAGTLQLVQGLGGDEGT